MQHIRSATADDAGRIAQIIVTNYRINFYPFFRNDAYYFGELNVADTAAEYKQDRERLADTFVYDDGVIRGVICIHGTEVQKLFVEPAFQGRGIGAELLRYAVTQHQADHLRVLEYNTRGIAFYQRHGFVLTGEKETEDEIVPLLMMRRQP